MSSVSITLLVYCFLGLLLVLFSKTISNFVYNIILMYTDKMNLKDVFLFKIDHSNRDSFFKLARWFIIFLGSSLILFCGYSIFG